jgi:hypothetical protein
MDLISFFCMWISSFPVWFAEKVVLFSLNGLDIFVKYHLSISTISLVFMPVAHCFDYCSFVVSLEIRKCEF